MVKLPLFATTGKTLKSSLQELYQAMGYSLLTSFLWFIACLPSVFVLLMMISALPNLPKVVQVSKIFFQRDFLFGATVMSLFNGFLAGPFTTALFGLYQERKENYPSIRLFFKNFCQFYWISARVHLCYSVGVSVLLFNVVAMLLNHTILFTVAGIFSIYGLLFLLLISLYLHPLMFYQNRFKNVFKKAFILVLDNFVLTLGLIIGLLVIGAISIFLIFPIILLFGAFYVYYLDHGFEFIYQKYEAVEQASVKEE